jgi:hypothetical protein
MAKRTITLVNQTGSPVGLKLYGGIEVPASGTIDVGGGPEPLVGMDELQRSQEIYNYVDGNTLLVQINGTTLTKSESLEFLEGLSIASNYDVDTVTSPPITGDSLVFDGTNWVPSSGAGGAGSNNYVFAYDTTIQDAGAQHAEGDVILTGGASGSVDSITVNGVEIMSGSEPFDTDLNTTAANIAQNISNFTSTPNYSAISIGPVVDIFAVDSGTGPNGFVITSAATIITTTDVDMSGGTEKTSNTYAPVFFSSNGQLDGWTHNINTAAFKCNVTSQYAATVEFNVEKSGSGSPEASLVVTIDGTQIPGSHQGMDITSNNTAFSLSRTFLFNANAGQVLEVDFAANIGGGGNNVFIVPAPDPTGTSLQISATLTIRRLT